MMPAGTLTPTPDAASGGRPARRLLPASLGMFAFLAACSGGDGGSGPGPGPGPTVNSVEVAGAAATVEVGQSIQLTATARDAQNNVIAGKTFTWTSNNQGVATVSPSGLVQGVAAGNATISATTDGRTGSYPVTVTAPPPLVLSSVTPNPLVPGQSATLTGAGFSDVPANNTVSIAGTTAAVTSASATSLTVTVPSSLCTAGVADVNVRVGARTSNTIQAPAPNSGSLVNLAVGTQTVVNNPANFCLRFDATNATETYLIGVTSFTESVTSVTPVTVAAATAGPSPDFGMVPPPPSAQVVAQDQLLPVDLRRMLRWQRHRADEMNLRRQQMTQVGTRFPVAGAAGAEAALSAIPGTVNVGDAVPIRVPNRNANLCTSFTQISTTVAAVSQRAVILTDNANPTGGYTASDLQTMATTFDGIWDKNAEWFNAPVGGSGARIVIVITQSINQFEILGFVSTSDLNANCASTNNDNIFYARAPNPADPADRRYTREEGVADAPILLAHELTHIIQFTRRLAAQAQFQSIWELEGQATFAEIINGFAASSRQFGQNYGFNVAFNREAEQVPHEWFIGSFIDLVLYYGFNANCDPNVPGNCDIPIAGTPEQCSWLDLQTNGNNGPCFPGREVYGVPAFLFNWLSDHFGPGLGANGRQEVQRRLIGGTSRGFANIQAAVGESMETLLPQWAASFHVDDRVAGANARLTHPSWNLLDVESRLRPSAQLRPRQRSFATFSESAQVRGGSTVYFRVSGTGRSATTIRARGSSEAILPGIMRMWVVRLQ